MENGYKYWIGQSGLLVRKNDRTYEVFDNCEWRYPEASIGYQMPVTLQEANTVIIQVLKKYYQSKPEYKDKTLPGC